MRCTCFSMSVHVYPFTRRITGGFIGDMVCVRMDSSRTRLSSPQSLSVGHSLESGSILSSSYDTRNLSLEHLSIPFSPKVDITSVSQVPTPH